MKKRLAAFVGLVLCGCLLFCGCNSAKLLLYQMLGGEIEDGAAVSSSEAPVNSPAALSSSAPDASAEEEGKAPSSSAGAFSEAPPAVVEEESGFLPAALAEALTLTNGDIKAAQGSDCYSYIMYGGSPTVDYTGRAVKYPVAFLLLASQEEFLVEWSAASPDAYPVERNVFSDSYPVACIDLYEEGLGALFGGQLPTYEALCAELGAPLNESFLAAGEGIDSYDFDSWHADFALDGYSYLIEFRMENGEKLPFRVILAPL